MSGFLKKINETIYSINVFDPLTERNYSYNFHVDTQTDETKEKIKNSFNQHTCEEINLTDLIEVFEEEFKTYRKSAIIKTPKPFEQLEISVYPFIEDIKTLATEIGRLDNGKDYEINYFLQFYDFTNN